ncbi:group I truncated hemoglobin [Caulobacter sp. KR2-114]|uniref:group I truncated hemoglobin n=1 Tax=Caulobacter sp. KR2-114 TaxID=3400912 RepID=UPI003C0E1D1C
MTTSINRGRMAVLVAVVSGFGLASAAMAEPDAPPPAVANPAGATPIEGDATYKAFHEKDGIQRIMDDFIQRITHDPRIERRFTDANLTRLNLLLVEQVCYLTGGPCEYGGKDMKSAHAAMGLRNDDFNALAEDLQLSMDKEGVSFAAQNRLLAKLAPMQRAIVTR